MLTALARQYHPTMLIALADTMLTALARQYQYHSTIQPYSHPTIQQFNHPTMKNHQPSNQPTANKPPLCFPNTDVPMAYLFIHFEHGYSTAQFLRDFPSVPAEQVHILLEWVTEVFKTPNLMASVLIELSDREEEG